MAGIVKAMHTGIKAALFSETGTDEFTKLLTTGLLSRIYDTVGLEDTNDPYCIWTMEGTTVDVHFDGKERITATVAVTIVTPYTDGLVVHLNILDALSALRQYSSAAVHMKLDSIGEITLDDQKLVSVNHFLATSERLT